MKFVSSFKLVCPESTHSIGVIEVHELANLASIEASIISLRLYFKIPTNGVGRLACGLAKASGKSFKRYILRIGVKSSWELLR